MAKKVALKFSLEGLIREDKDTNCFVSYCPALDIYSAGMTRPQAKAALQSAIDLFIRVCFDRQSLGRVLQSKGFVMVPAPEHLSGGEFIAVAAEQNANVSAMVQGAEYDDRFTVEVPLALVAQQQAQQHAGVA